MSDPIIGSTVTIQATFKDINGALVDPVVTLTVNDPSGDVTTPAPTNPSVGVYQHELDLNEAGIWKWRWEGDSTEGNVVCESSICVSPSAVMSV